MSHLIKAATIDDLNEVTSLMHAYQRFYNAHHEKEKTQQFMAERLRRKDSLIFLLFTEQHSPAVGIAQCYSFYSTVSLGKIWLLQDLYIHTSHQRQGHGCTLLKHVLATAKEDQALRVTLKTQKINHTAQAFYQRIGFKEENDFMEFLFSI